MISKSNTNRPFFYINRYYGWSIVFCNGLSLGFNWMHGNGESSKTCAILAAFHSPKSITWRWSLSWSRARGLLLRPRFDLSWSGYGWCSFCLPLIGCLSLNWQPTMPDKEAI